jgi:nitrogen regulatory protein PII
MTTVTSRDSLVKFHELYEKHDLDVHFIALGRGTASEDVADLLGLRKSENAVGFTIVSSDTWKKLKADLYKKLGIDAPNAGIVTCSPISSIGGEGPLAYFTDGQSYERKEESVLKETARELLIVICNQGYSTTVMDAARSAGASGGTVIHATGAGIKKSEEFLGVTLATEKSMIFIIVNKEQKRPVMEAIMNNAGLDSKAKSVVFSLPVTDSAGLKNLDKLIDAEE